MAGASGADTGGIGSTSSNHAAVGVGGVGSSESFWQYTSRSGNIPSSSPSFDVGGIGGKGLRATGESGLGAFDNASMHQV